MSKRQVVPFPGWCVVEKVVSRGAGIIDLAGTVTSDDMFDIVLHRLPSGYDGDLTEGDILVLKPGVKAVSTEEDENVHLIDMDDVVAKYRVVAE